MKTYRIRNKKLLEAVDLAGGQVLFAAEVNKHLNGRKNPKKIDQRNVWSWLYRNEIGPPPQYCAAIECAVNGAVTREQLRPDIFEAPLPQAIGDRA